MSFTKQACYCILLLMLCLHYNNIVKADVVAGEINYRWISTDTYEIIYKGYFDCKNGTIPNQVDICVKNTCNNTSTNYTLDYINGTLPHNNKPNGSEISIGCSNSTTNCTNLNSTILGHKECWYIDTITVSPNCNNWEITTVTTKRGETNNVISGNQYLKTTINLLPLQNSTPTLFRPVIYTCINAPNIIINNYTDNEGDSISIELLTPLTSTLGQTCIAPISVNNKPATPPISHPNNPLQSFNTFYIDTVTWDIHFTSTDTGTSLISLLIKEYRFGTYIGSYQRDIQIVTNKCSTVPPSQYYITDKFINSALSLNQKTIYGCAGNNVEFCIDIKAFDTANSHLYITDNLSSILPSAQIIYDSLGSDSVRACFSWATTTTDTGTYRLILTFTDSNCSIIRDPFIFRRQHTLQIKQPDWVNISQSPNSHIWPYLNVEFEAQHTPCKNPSFQWTVNGKDIPGADSSKWNSTTLNDRDTVKCRYLCKDELLCPNANGVLSNNLYINIAVNIDELNKNKINIYPNPNDGKFTIELDSKSLNATHELEVTNIFGQIVHAETFTGNKKVIDLVDVASGVYMLKISSGDETKTIRFTVR